jgi:hypothetical protein
MPALLAVVLRVVPPQAIAMALLGSAVPVRTMPAAFSRALIVLSPATVSIVGMAGPAVLIDTSREATDVLPATSVLVIEMVEELSAGISAAL